jgi:FlaA1/EpsC-like NDP-sugar epimerase
MTIPEASQLVIQAGAMGVGGEIFVLDMGEPVRILDLAKDMIRLSGLQVEEDIAIEFTGLRAGEKLYEELHLEGERQLPTDHPKIIVADRLPADPQRMKAAILEIEKVAHNSPERVRDFLQTLIPEYQVSDRKTSPVHLVA